MHENCVPKEEFDKAVARIRELEARIKELEALLEKFLGPHVPPSLREARYPKREPTGKPPGKPKGSPGATRKLKPDEKILVKLEKCKKCRYPLGEAIGIERRICIEIPPPQKPIIREFQLEKYVCSNCARENIASDPGCPTKGEFGPRALALVQDLRFRERLSIAMTRRVLRERFGIENA